MGIFDRLSKPNVEELEANRDIKGLIKALRYKEYEIRSDAAEALGKIGDAKAIEPLITALKDDYAVPTSAIYALVEMGEPAIEPLIHALKNDDYRVRKGAADALGHIGDRRAVEPLIHALKYARSYADQSVQSAAASALGYIGDRRAVEPLIHALQHENSIVRMYAVSALGDIGDARATEHLIRALGEEGDVQARAKEALIKIGEPAVEPLVRALGDKDEVVRIAVAEILIKVGKPAVEPLFPMLNHKTWYLQDRAARVLGEIGDERAVSHLLPLLRTDTVYDEWYTLQWTAANALAKIGEPAVEPLKDALNNERYSDKTFVKEALEMIKKRQEK